MENKLTSEATHTNGVKSKSKSPSPAPAPAPMKNETEDSKPASDTKSIKKEVEPPRKERRESKDSEMKTEPVSNAKGQTPTPSSSSSAAPTPDPTPASVDVDGDTDPDATTSYEIKWNNYTSVLQNVFRKVLISHQFSDVTLACEGESIKCHRILLAACSSYFEKLLTENQDSKLVIYMKDMKIWELKALVNFMYNGQVSVQESQLPSFMKAAEALNISGLDGAAPTGESSNGTAEAKTVSESTVPAKIISTFKRPSSGGSDNSYVSAAVKRPAISAQIRPVPALQAQPRYSAAGVQETMKRKIVLSNIQGGPPKLVRMQQARSNGINNLGVRTNSWGGVGVAKTNQNGAGGSPLGQVVGYENEDYADDDEMDQATGDDDSQGLQGIDGGEQSLDDVEPTTNGQVENCDEDEEDGNEPYENDDDGTYDDGQMMNVYGLEGNQDDEQFDDDDEPPYEGEMDGEDGMMVINETPLPRTRNGRSYAPELQEAAFDALRNGVSIRQCSELYGIPRKTLGKWKNRGLHLQPSTVTNNSLLNYNSTIPKKRGPAVGSTLSGPEGIDRARRLQKATKMAMSGITVRQAAAHFDIPRTTLCAYMKRQGLASQARNINSAKAQSLYQQQLQQRRVGATTITLSRNSGTGGNYRLATNTSGAGRQEQQDMDNGDEEEDEIPFLGLSDFIDQNSDNWEGVN